MSSGPARVVDVTEEEEGRQGPRTRMDKFLAFMGDFYTHAMDGDHRPDMKPDDLVAEIFDPVAREEFFDYLTLTMHQDAPSFSFSFFKTFSDMLQFLENILKEPFTNMIDKEAWNDKETPEQNAESQGEGKRQTKPDFAPAVHAGKPADTDDDEDEMPGLEKVELDKTDSSKSASSSVSSTASSTSASKTSQTDEDSMRGRVLFHLREENLEEATRILLTEWNLDMLKGFLAEADSKRTSSNGSLDELRGHALYYQRKNLPASTRAVKASFNRGMLDGFLTEARKK